MAGPHHNDLPPYLVSLDDAESIAVDPAALKEGGCFLTHVRGNRYVLHRGTRTRALIINAEDRKNVHVTHGAQTVATRVLDHRDQLLAAWGAAEGNAGRESRIEAPMPGLVLKVLVTVGQSVTKGDSLLVLEAMKMENDIKAHFDGVVSSVNVGTGDAVGKGHTLMEFA